MTLKNVLVQVDAAPTSTGRLQVAVTLAAAHDAALRGLFVIPQPYIPPYVDFEIPVEVMAEHEARLRQQAEQARREFAEMSKDLATASWQLETGDPLALLLRQARYSDLVLVSRGQADSPVLLETALVERLALQSGTGVLALPASGAFSGDFRHVLVGWKERREAVAAVHAALPLMQKATRVTAVTVGSDDGTAPAALCAYLARHGISCEHQRLGLVDGSVGNSLLTLARMEEADLVVIGAYGHTRLQEWILGGVTRHLLAHASVPLLIAH